MRFINRSEESMRLNRLVSQNKASLAIVYGRRRVGKSRLLIEYCEKNNGIYWVADESSAVIQRQYFIDRLSEEFPELSNVNYPSWSSIFKAISREAKLHNWRGPLIIDELPYLAKASPELPSELQHWIDSEKRSGLLIVALAGSSQQMMFDVALNASSPLYGRADETLLLQPILPGYISEAFPKMKPSELFMTYTLWGGIPRYWELAVQFEKNWKKALNQLVLSPLGPLHDEVNRLLRDEQPSAIHLRPILDCIGMGAHKLSEIAARLKSPATSLSKSLAILMKLGLIEKEIPFGSDEKNSKKSLYKLSDPFLRLWFCVVAPNKGALNVLPEKTRLQYFIKQQKTLQNQSFEEICLKVIPYLNTMPQTFINASRYWGAGEPEWDIVAESLDQKQILIGECKFLDKPLNLQKALKEFESLKKKGLPKMVKNNKEVLYLLCVSESHVQNKSLPDHCFVIDLEEILKSLK